MIRPATPADIPAMRDLEARAGNAAHWTADAYDKIFSGDRPRVALVCEQEQVVGFVVGSQNGPEWEIENIVVAAQFRKRGSGSTMLGAFLDVARQAGACEVLLEVRASNHSARSFYVKHGFAENGRRPGYYENPREDAVLYRKQVNVIE